MDWSNKYDESKPITGERDYILRIFDFYTRIHENFEAAGYAQPSRDLLEDYTTAILLPACASCSRLLRRGSDSELMSAYFRLVYAARASASEEFSFHLGEIFVANPTLVETAYRRLPAEQQPLALAKLDWGFRNVIYGKKVTPEIKRLEKRLERMKPAPEDRTSSNQAMQRTASKPAIYVLRVCHLPFGCVARSTGLAVADLVSR